jgi:ABC-type glycerol-3-phosphate transport system substrate-binding protein
MTLKKIIILVLIISITSILLILGLKKDHPILTHAFQKDIELNDFQDDEYLAYLSMHDEIYPEQEIVLDYSNLNLSSTGYEIVDGNSYEQNGNLILSDEVSTVTFDFYVEESGYYNIEMDYFPIEGKSSNIERLLKINGEVPYRAAERLVFNRIWVSESNDFIVDQNGNDIIPRQIESPEWTTTPFKDADGFVQGQLLFYFDSGIQSLTLESLKEPLLIKQITILNNEDLISYDMYQNNYSQNADQITDQTAIIIQGQHMHQKSSPVLYPISDRTSSVSTPQSSYALKANTGGGYNWRVVGDWISYKFNVEEAGFYQISLRAKQNFIRGAYVTRQIKIDGQVPFEEVAEVPFIYGGDWNLYTLGKNEAYEFYLEPGEHEIQFEVILGDFNQAIQEVSKVINTLNQAYRDIIMITTAQPDLYRDYNLDDRLPDLLGTFLETKEKLDKVSETLYEMTGETSQHTVILDKVSLQLEGFIKEPETIHKRLGEFQNNISALGAWIIEIKEQPLAIDYIAIHSPDYEFDRINGNMFQNLWFGLNNFIASFVVDYNALSSASNVENTQGDITVWLGTGRDQANIIRRMIDEDFSEVHKIGVNLQLVSMDVLLPATLTGKGPDVAIGVGNQIPVNYAMRNAAYDLSQFDDFDQIAQRFKESAMVPYNYLDGYYALPETQQFPVMFYREDILNELNIEIPKTWDDVINIIPELQRVNLDFYLPIDIVEQVQGVLPPNIMFMTLLYQNGGSLYLNEGRESGLSERVALDSFKKWTDFYTNYRFQIQANFVNRFRSGEMPIGISYYSMYNTLTVFAPEISGQWGFTNVPGIDMGNGEINNIVPTTGTGIVLLNQSEEKDLAWEFMKWWTKTETQVRFGREMEGILGAAARYPTANIEALSQLPWPAKDLAVLESQWDNTFGIPEVPGGYFTGRHIDNALRKVINTGANPRDTLYEYIRIINAEIETKRREFDLD